ncbi:RNA polymerase sigma-54 factor [Nioella sp.]|uniref:RNA polymerase factor sigma-54 n=1 Tax=Nioella sp. TaxID=1912091 RepID=UPI003A8869D7
MPLKQVQQQTQLQKLALTQTMRTSLSLLAMGQEDAAKLIEREQSRNAFLRSVPSIPAKSAAHHEEIERAGEQSRTDALLHQLRLMKLSERQARLAEGLVHSLDHRGFLPDTPQEITGYLECGLDELMELVAKLQREVEPAGVFAWSLADCFRLQLVARNRFDPLIERLLERLDLIASKDIAAICAECGVDEEDAVDMLEDIRSLDPAPLGHQPVPFTTDQAPDLLIHQDDDGGFSVALNEAAMPTLLVDDALFSTTMAAETDDRAQVYYRDCYREAGNMVRAMQKRANTILAIGTALARHQEKFIRTGRDRDRQPLTMALLASEIGVNKSTISRAMSGCSIRTDRGTYAATAFLARPLNDQESGRTRDQALQRLKLLIATENTRNPFSDEDLAGQLKKAGMPMSRRTVAKYRAMLAIPGAYERRQKQA